MMQRESQRIESRLATRDAQSQTALSGLTIHPPPQDYARRDDHNETYECEARVKQLLHE
jgi:hypothetical protein